ncbi:hypothetical protein TSUD_188230 [Trifolium subterraneum]|uniref:Pectate lyase superfamily protein domain-containing protein n=1 Tax=Trifolium subterraneum TaxID=3900 RepID=A0A2Z6P9B5_TRISU|nr:hypothetical protein TSUD_188230 [Trifolium subterraneum]
MDKFFLVSLLGLLIVANGVSGSMMCRNNFGMLDELNNLDTEEENEVELSDIPSWTSERGGKVLVNVDSFGAVGNGEADDTQALQKAWGVACSTPKSVLLVPQGRRYLVNATKFIGPCKDNLIIQPCIGDDCISIVNASSNIKMKRIHCGPGHGISIGSLGKDNSTGVVTKVILDTAFIKDTTNGLRIKTWQGGAGYVKGVRFQNVMVENVSNPILIDQFYCDSPSSCQNQSSALEIMTLFHAAT